MTDKDRTHYRKAFDAPYLSCADIVEPTVLTIESVRLEKNKAGKKEVHNTAYFAEKEIRPGEKLKPMVINVTNSKIMTAMCGSPFIDDWRGTVTIHADPDVKWGNEAVGGLRIVPGSAYVSESQAADLDALIDEVAADKAAFLKWASCESIDKFPVAKLGDAMRMLKAKRQ